jgi:hypothetical protein
MHFFGKRGQRMEPRIMALAREPAGSERTVALGASGGSAMSAFAVDMLCIPLCIQKKKVSFMQSIG